MAQVDSDPRPGGRSAAHRIDQHVISVEKLRNLGMFALPSLQTRKRGLLAWRVRNDDQRHLGSRLVCDGPGARRCNPARFVLRLAKVRRPGRVTEARGVVSCRKFEQLFERTGGSVDAFLRIADLAKTF